MAILEKLGLFLPQKKLDKLIDALGKTVDLLSQVSIRLVELENRVKDWTADKQPGEPSSLLDCGLCGLKHIEVPCPNVALGFLKERLPTIPEKECCGGECNKTCVDGNPYSHADHIEEEETECDGCPCTCGSTDQEFEEHVKEETKSFEDILNMPYENRGYDISADDVPELRASGWQVMPAEEKLRTGSESDPDPRSYSAEHLRRTQDTGYALEDWQLDAVQRAILERLKPFVGTQLTRESVAHARAVAQMELEDMCRRFRTTRKYYANVDGIGGQLRVEITD